MRTKHTCTSKDIEQKVCRTTVVPLCRVGIMRFTGSAKMSNPQITHDDDPNFWNGERFPDFRGNVRNASRTRVCAGAVGTSTRAEAFVSSKACQGPLAFQVTETIAECHQINYNGLGQFLNQKTVGMRDMSMHTTSHAQTQSRKP